MKKVISLVLVSALILSVLSCAFSVVAASDDTDVYASANSTTWVFEPVSGKTIQTAQGALQAYTVKSKESGKYLTISKSGTDADGAPVEFYGTDRNENDDKQLWGFFEVSGGIYNLVNAACQINGTAGMIWYNGNGSFEEYELTSSGWASEGNAIVLNGNGTINGQEISELADASGCFEATMNFRYDNIAYIYEDYEIISEDETVVNLDSNKKTVWVFEPAGGDVPTHSVYAATYTIKSKASGKYLTAIDKGDGTVSLCTKDRDENDNGQLWAFDALWGEGILAIINAGCADPCNADYSAMLYLDGGKLKKDCQRQSGDGNKTVILGGTDAGISDVTTVGVASDGNIHPNTSLLRSFEATINFQSPTLYFYEEYESEEIEEILVSLDNTKKTTWKFEYTGEDLATVSVYAATYTIKSKASGKYLTATDNGDGTVSLCTKDRDENDKGQLWGFDALQGYDPEKGVAPVAIINAGCEDPVERVGYESSAMLIYDNGLKKAAQEQAGDGNKTVLLNGIDAGISDVTTPGVASSVTERRKGLTLQSFEATINFQVPTLYFYEEYYGIAHEEPQTEPTEKTNDVVISSNNAFSTEWRFTPVREFDCYNADGSYAQSAGENAKGIYAYTIQSTKTGGYLTAVYNSDYTAITLQTGTRDTTDDRQVWAFTKVWPDYPYYGMLNLGYMRDCSDNSGNQYPAYIMQDRSVNTPHGGGSPNTGDIVNFGHISGMVGDKTIDSLVSAQGNTFVTAFGVNSAYYMEQTDITDPTVNAPAPSEIINISYDSAITVTDEKGGLEFIPIALEDIYTIGGGSCGKNVIYAIKSSKTGAFLTATYNDNDNSIALSFAERDITDDGQRWAFIKAFPNDTDFPHYFVLNMGKMSDCTDSSGNKSPAVLMADLTAGEFETVNQGDGLYIWNLTTSSSAENLLDSLTSINADGSFVAALTNCSSNGVIYEKCFDLTGEPELKILDVRNIVERTLTKNNDLKWKFTAVGDYFTIQNQRTGLYITMFDDVLYTSARDESNNYQLWKLVDNSEAYEDVEYGIYEIQCYNTGKAINMLDGEFKISNVSSRGAEVGRFWTLDYNSGLFAIEDATEFTAPINTYHYDGDESETQYYLAGEASVWGDLNDDTVCNLLDLVKFKKAIAEQITSQEPLSNAYDLDAVEKIGDSNDLIALVEYLIGK